MCFMLILHIILCNDPIENFFQVNIYILPKNVRRIDWILRPLVAGFVALPTLSLTVPAGNNTAIQFNEFVFSFIYIPIIMYR